MKLTGLLGGSFNPAHGAHRGVTLFAMEALGLDEAWWLVSPGNPLKPKQGMAPLSARFRSAREQARRAPTITVETTSWCSSQAMAMAGTVTPRLSAIGRIASTRSNASCLSMRGKSSLARRPSPSVLLSCPSAYLPDSSPPASGLHTIRPSPSLCIIGTSSRSSSRLATV